MTQWLVRFAATAALIVGIGSLATHVKQPGEDSTRESLTGAAANDLRGDRNQAAWALSSVQDGGRVLEVAYFYGGCQDDLDEFTVSESATTVHVDVWIDDYDRNGQICTAMLRMACHTIELDQPLGRRVLTGPSDED